MYWKFSISLPYLLFICYCVFPVKPKSVGNAKGEANILRNKRSGCGKRDCDSNFISNHQNFYSNVTFNSYFSSGKCGSGSCENAQLTTKATTLPTKATTTTLPTKATTTTLPTKATTLTTKATTLPTTVIPIPTTTKPKNPDITTRKLTFTYKLEKKDLDLYFLMDATVTFEKTRRLLADKSDQFVDAIKKLDHTEGDYRIGYGTFSDKFGSPLDEIDEVGDEIQGRYSSQIRSHGLMSYLNLTKIEADQFKKIALKSKKSTLSGWKEDILTGIHQVATCVSQIGWREGTMRLLLLTTDEQYYTENEKVFVGEKPLSLVNTTEMVLKLDDKCHMDSFDFFADSDYNKYDYPSENQVRKLLNDNGITVIFAIGQPDWKPSSEDVFDEYQNTLAHNLQSNPILYRINTNDSNIVKNLTDIIQNAINIVTAREIIESSLTVSTKNVVVVERCVSNPIKPDSNECIVGPDTTEVTFEVEVSLPCPWTDTSVSLEVKRKGYSDAPSRIDLASLCNELSNY